MDQICRRQSAQQEIILNCCVLYTVQFEANLL